MSKTKLFLTSLLAASSFFVVSAQTSTSSPKVVSEVFATVNIYNAITTLQKDNTFTIDFDISNRVGVQPGIKYGISLVKINDGKISLIDERVYGETLVLRANETIHKTVIYTAPANLSGEYSLMVSSKSSSGVPFAIGQIGKVNLQARNNTVVIDSSSCYLTNSGDKTNIHYSLDQKVSVDNSQALTAHCFVKNNSKVSVTLIPQIVENIRSNYGDIVPNLKSSTEETVISPQQKKEISVNIPLASTPQTYFVRLFLSDIKNQIETNAVTFRYAILGVGASIRTILLDKDSYIKGDTALASFIWSPLVDTFSNGEYKTSVPLSSPSATFSIVNGENKSCGLPITNLLGSEGQLLKVSIPINENCINPQVYASITDTVNGTLDTQSFSITSRIETTPLSSNLSDFTKNKYVIVIGIVLLLLLLSLYMKRKSAVPVVMLLLAFSFIGGANRLYAEGVVLYYVCSKNPCPQATSLFMNFGLDKASYSPGDTINVDYQTFSDDNPQPPSGSCLYASGSVNGGAYGPDAYLSCYSPDVLRNGGAYGTASAGTAPSTSGTVYTYLGSNGYGSKSGTLSFTVTAPPTVQLNFSFLDKAKLFTRNIIDTFIEKTFAAK